MRISRLFRAVAVVAVALIPASAVSASPTARASIAVPNESGSAEGIFEGQVIELDGDWGAARACVITDIVTRCFRSERQMDRFLAAQSPERARTDGAAEFAASTAMTCGSSVRLYDGLFFTGTVLSTAIRWTYLNLANYGFSNRTSSYRIGGCAVELYAGENGSGGVYPGGTWAGAVSGSMLFGWTNAISSLYMF
jgi:hypothetical protein